MNGVVDPTPRRRLRTSTDPGRRARTRVHLQPLAARSRIARMPRSVITLSLILSAVLGSADVPPAKPPLSKSAQRAAARNARPAPDAPPSPEEVGRLLVEQKCGKCHDASRAVSAALSESAWKAHMKRMGKFPGAAITEEQGKQIHEYLKANVAP